MDEPVVVSRSVVLCGKQRKCLAPRAFNRYCEEKKKAKAYKWWTGSWWGKRYGEPSIEWIGMMAATPKHYPCWMCGNPRRWFGIKTFQEHRAEAFAEAQLEELGE